jgi:hypothetical protein
LKYTTELRVTGIARHLGIIRQPFVVGFFRNSAVFLHYLSIVFACKDSARATSEFGRKPTFMPDCT